MVSGQFSGLNECDSLRNARVELWFTKFLRFGLRKVYKSQILKGSKGVIIMPIKKMPDKECNKMMWKHHYMHGGKGGMLYGLGFIGALIYYVSTAATFWMGVLGVLKAIVWPAFLVYHLLTFLGV